MEAVSVIQWLPGPPDLFQAKLDPYYRLTGLGIMREPLSLIVARIYTHHMVTDLMM